LLVLTASCAPAIAPPAPLAPADVPAVEQRLARDPGDVAARLELADAYRNAGQADAAVTMLQPVLATEPAATYFLALVRESQGYYSEARRLYQEYLERGRDPQVRRQVKDRLVLLSRLELQEAARYALSREQQLAGTPPAPNVVGVFPFLTVTQDEQLRPLGTALAELLTTDLAQTNRLRVVERAQVQALLDELKLAESGRVDTTTAARSGRMLGAGRLVQGRAEGSDTSIALQAAVVEVPRENAALNPLQEQSPLARIFELEKQLALGIYDRLGIQLTAAERQRVLRQQTTSVQALLEFGFGLETQDAGNYQEAAQHFARAVQLDPRFRLAINKLAEARTQESAATLTPLVLAQLGFREFEALRRAGTFQALNEFVPDPSVRDPSAEVLGTEGATRHGTIDIVISRPGGTP